MGSTHRHAIRPLLVTATPAIVAAILLGACGGDGGPEPSLSAAGAAGRDVVRSNGCAACHGRNGEGSPGPAFADLYGSTVELKDGEVAVADHDYLYESITDPRAKLVEGFGFPMPENDLHDDEIEQVIAFIRDLSTQSTGGTEPAGS